MNKRQEAYRLVTVVQITFSIFSLFIVSIVLPLLYNLVQQTSDYADKELKFCDVSKAVFVTAHVSNEIGLSYLAINKSLTSAKA